MTRRATRPSTVIGCLPPEYAKELEEARREIAKGKVHAFEDVVKELGLGGSSCAR